MNPRTYLRLLHPVHAVLWTWFYTAGGIGVGVVAFPGDISNQFLVGVTTLLPLLFGLCVASAAHAAMHRPFFPLLPGGIRRLRRATFLTLALVAPLIAGGVASFLPVPFFAVLGLAAALLALPLTNPRSNWLNIRPGWRSLVISGYIFFVVFGRAKLDAALHAAPWAFLLGGGAVAAWCFHCGFSPRHIRARAEIPYNSIAGGFLTYVNFSAAQRHRQEAAQHRTRLAPGITIEGHDWPVRLVGADTRSWMRVFRHATYGRNRHHSYLKGQFLVTLTAVFYAAFIPLLGFVFSRAEGEHAFTFTHYWQALAGLSAPQWSPTDGGSGLIAFIQTGICATLALMVIRPQLPYPLSRRRIARVVLTQSVGQIAVALLLPTLAFFILSLIGQLMASHYQPGLGLPSLTTLALAWLPLLPLLACTSHVRSAAGRILLAVPIGITMIIATVTRAEWSAAILTLPGLGLVAVTTTATFLLLRRRLTRHYQTCDLNTEFSSTRPSPTIAAAVP